jgi:hypothetical protein
MLEFSLKDELQKIDSITSVMEQANMINDTTFRNVCKDVFEKAFSESEFNQNFEMGMTMIGLGIGSAIKQARGQYVEGSFAKSISEIKPKNETNSDLNKILHFLEKSPFHKVANLLRIQCAEGLKKSVSSIDFL